MKGVWCRSRAWSVGFRVTALLASLWLGSAARAEVRGNVNLLLGQKVLDDQWAPVDRQLELAGSVDFRSARWPVSAALAVFYSWADEDEGTFRVRGEILEFHAGAVKVFNDDDDWTRFRPFFGGGMAVAQANQSLDRTGLGSEHDRDLGVGGWVGAGVYWNPFGNLNLGVDVRWSTVRVRLLGEDFDAGGLHLGVLAGWRWFSL